MRRLVCCVFAALVFLPAVARAQQPLSLIDVPFISQSEALCGGAAAAMVLRFWGEQGLTAESFSALVDRTAGGISTSALATEVQRRGFEAVAVRGDDALLRDQLAQGRPVIALVEDRPHTFHYIVVVAWHERGVVFHDPARAPFRVTSTSEFERRWLVSDRWMLVVTPAARPGTPVPPPPGIPAAASSCDQLVADGVREAQANHLENAERLLTPAIACAGGTALRELAGVRLLQQRWPDVEALASAAVAQDPNDQYAWKLLGTARYVTDDAEGALNAWNRAAEPRLDLVRVDGLRRTRQRVIERLTGLDVGSTLTTPGLRRARRQIAELPSARATGVSYVPAPNGAAELRVAVAERALVPSGIFELGRIAITAVTAREVTLGLSSPTGGGERITGSWRFWPHRPRYAVGLTSPAPWGGTWGVSGAVEEQPFVGDAVAPSRRASAELTAGQWATDKIRWEAGGGADRWDEEGRFAALRGGGRLFSAGDRLEARGDLRTWFGASTFSTLLLSAVARSSSADRGTVLIARGTSAATTIAAPLSLWAAGDTGSARPTLLRAHPVLDDGHLRVDRLGRLVVAGSLEAQRWRRAGLVSVASAVFADVARTSRRRTGAPVADVDVGTGIRVRLAGTPGTLRVDLAKGLHDGATALSLVYEP